MSVYVDPLKHYARPAGAKASYTGKGEWWCHMMADTHEELIAMADRLHLPRKWFQAHRRQAFEHYDLTPGIRAKVVAFGAIELSHQQLREHLVRALRTEYQRP